MVVNPRTTEVAKKTSTQPPYHFVFLDACNTASDSSLANSFGIGSTSSNRAFLGYSTLVNDTLHNVNWANRVCTHLKDGKTISEAVDAASAAAGGPPTK